MHRDNATVTNVMQARQKKSKTTDVSGCQTELRAALITLEVTEPCAGTPGSKVQSDEDLVDGLCAPRVVQAICSVLLLFLDLNCF
jgi:hypothetical protein